MPIPFWYLKKNKINAEGEQKKIKLKKETVK